MEVGARMKCLPLGVEVSFSAAESLLYRSCQQKRSGFFGRKNDSDNDSKYLRSMEITFSLSQTEMLMWKKIRQY